MQKNDKQTNDLRFLLDFLRNFMSRNVNKDALSSYRKWKAKGYTKTIVLRPVNTRGRKSEDTSNVLVLPRKDK